MALTQQQTREAIVALWAEICCIQDDVACNLLPLASCLERARAKAEDALVRNGTPIMGKHEPMKPLPAGFPFHERPRA